MATAKRKEWSSIFGVIWFVALFSAAVEHKLNNDHVQPFTKKVVVSSSELRFERL